MIIYYDLGACIGDTVQAAISVFNSFKINKYMIYAFEPFPANITRLVKRFNNNQKVILVKAVVGSKTQTSNLFLAPSRLSHSIYSSKSNVNPNKSMKVEQVQFSDWFNKNKLISKINIVKMNIEGAEYDVIKDLFKSGLYKNIDILLFHSSKKGYYPSDLDKVNLSNEQKKEISDILHKFQESGMIVSAQTDKTVKLATDIQCCLKQFLLNKRMIKS